MMSRSQHSPPPKLFHATPIENLDNILQHGLRPQIHSDARTRPQDQHINRVFLSMNDDPTEMCLPMNLLDQNLVILAIDTKILDWEKMYPDDGFYWAFENDQLSEEELAELFPDLYDVNKEEGEYESFGDYLDDNLEMDDKDFDQYVRGKWYLSLYNNENSEACTCQGIIFPEAILVHGYYSSGSNEEEGRVLETDRCPVIAIE